MSASAQSTRNGMRSIRVWILLFVVVNIVTVENKRCVLGDVHPIIHKVLGRIVGLSHPKRRAVAQHLRNLETHSAHPFIHDTNLFNDAPDIWEALFVFGRWPRISANHHIKLRVRLTLDIGM